jgi:hypothetical protein
MDCDRASRSVCTAYRVRLITKFVTQDRPHRSMKRIHAVTLCVLAGSMCSCAIGSVIYRTLSAFKPLPRSPNRFALSPLRLLSQHEAGFARGAVSLGLAMKRSLTRNAITSSQRRLHPPKTPTIKHRDQTNRSHTITVPSELAKRVCFPSFDE